MAPLQYTIASGFVLLTLIYFGLVLKHLRWGMVQSGWTEKKQQGVFSRTVITLMVWAVIVSAASLSGFSMRFDLFPLNMAPLLLTPLIGMLIITFSGKTKHLLQFVPNKVLVKLQVFRVFVEILLWLLFLQNVIPVQLTFEGRNFDILAGITAPVIAYFFADNRKVLIVWNLVCLGLLINIVGTAILSLPTFLRVFDNEPSSAMVTTFPFFFLPSFLVPLAYGLHFLSLRKLTSGK